MVSKKNQLLETILCMVIGLFGIFLVSGLVYGIIMIAPANVYEMICNNDNYTTALSISYQVIFLTTTLLSGLSDKSETIYWERFTEYVLVNPFLFNFKGLSGIAFLTLITETIAFFIKGELAAALFYGSFLFGIVIIVLLSARMSSIYFNREHFLKRMLEKEKDPGLDKIETLKDMTIIAASNQNSRVVKENLELFCNLVGRETVTDDFVRVMLEMFDALFDQNNYAEYLDLITECILSATHDPSKETSQDVVLWILRDPMHVEIWNACIRKLDQRVGLNCGLFYKCLREYKKRVLSSLPMQNEMLSNAESFAMDTMERKEIDDARKLINDYETKVVCALDFMLECRLLIELEAVLSIFLDGTDPVSLYPVPYPHIDARERGILLSLLGAIKNDETKLSELILSYSIVVFTMAHESVKYDPDRDDIFAERLTKVFFGIPDPDENLKDVYHAFMVETSRSQEVRNKYILRIASDCSKSEESILRMKNIIGFDSWLDEASADCFDDDTDEQKAGYAEGYKKSLDFWSGVQEILKKDPESYKQVQEDIEEYMSALKGYCSHEN